MTVSPEVTEARRRWVEALESGEYEQAAGALRGNGGFCCLGLGCDVLGIGEWDGRTLVYGDELHREVPPEDFYERVGLPTSYGQYGEAEAGCLTFRNDGNEDRGIDAHTFTEIAAVLRDWFGPGLDRVLS